MTSVYALISISVYLAWRVWITSDRFKRSGSKVSPILFIELAYTAVMVYYLAIGSSSFLSVTLAVALIHVLFGFYVEIFQPHIRLDRPGSRDVLASYWSFLAVDVAISLSTYFLMIGVTHG